MQIRAIVTMEGDYKTVGLHKLSNGAISIPWVTPNLDFKVTILFNVK